METDESVSTCVFLAGDVYTHAEAVKVVSACVFTTGTMLTCADVGGVVNKEALEVFPNTNPGGKRLSCDEKLARSLLIRLLT